MVSGGKIAADATFSKKMLHQNVTAQSRINTAFLDFDATFPKFGM